GGFGQLILTAIAIAVAVLIAGPGAPLLAQIGAAVAGSVVSQGFGVATGLQEKFSFKQVALAGLSAGIGAGVGDVVKLGTAAGASAVSRFAGDVVRGAVTSAVSQGIAVATGLQNKFSFTAVAAAGIGAGIGGAVSRSVGGQATFNADGSLNTPASFGNMAASTMADTIAQAATRSILKGNSFGDNLIASLPSALGNLAGRALAGGLKGAFDGGGQSEGGSANQLAVEQTEGNRYAELAKLDPITQGAVQAEMGEEMITVTGSRPADRGFGLIAGDQYASSMLAGINRYNLKNRIIKDLDAQQRAPLALAGDNPPATAELSPSGYKDNPLIDGVPTTIADHTPWQSELDGRLSDYRAYRNAGIAAGKIYDRYEDDWVMEGFWQNQAYIDRIDAIADRMVWDVASAGMGLDLGTAVYRVGANGEHGIDNYITIGASALPLLRPLAKVGGRFVGNGVEVAAESNVARAASTDLVPVASKTLGDWGETRLSSFLLGQGVKPKNPFKTPLGSRFPDRLVDGISYESKAGLNVKLTSSIEKQIAKDAWLIKAGRIDGAEWHFWRGAQPELIQALQNAGIKAVVH
ncbi:MAG: hypothetical protein WA793_08280, partial [Sphingorhabdus sp.]